MNGGVSVFLTPAAERSCKKLPRPVCDFVLNEFVALVRKNSLVGDPLTPPLQPLRRFHFKVAGQKYRVA